MFTHTHTHACTHTEIKCTNHEGFKLEMATMKSTPSVHTAKLKENANKEQREKAENPTANSLAYRDRNIDRDVQELKAIVRSCFCQ